MLWTTINKAIFISALIDEWTTLPDLCVKRMNLSIGEFYKQDNKKDINNTT